jgi:hypothetical protein
MPSGHVRVLTGRPGFVRASCPIWVRLVVRLHDPGCVRAALARPFPRCGTEKPLDSNSFFFLSENREKKIVISCGCSFLRRRLEKKEDPDFPGY